MKKEYREAFSEVNELFKLMPIELINRIPFEFRRIIEEEKSKEYLPNIKEPIENVNLMKETIILLGLIYRDFLCSPEEKAILQENERRQLEELKNEMFSNTSEKTNYSELLSSINASKSQEISNVKKEEVSLTIQEKKWYQKIFDLIRGLFKLN